MGKILDKLFPSFCWDVSYTGSNNIYCVSGSIELLQQSASHWTFLRAGIVSAVYSIVCIYLLTLHEAIATIVAML